MENSGWTKRWRARWSKGYHKDHLLWVFMDYLIDHAVYQEETVFRKGVGKINMQRGEVVFSERELADFLGVDRQRIRTALRSLKKSEFLTQDLTQNPTHGITHIKIVNYDTYQSDNLYTNPQSNPQLPHVKPRPNPVQDSTISKRKKEYKETNYTATATANGFEAFWQAYPKRKNKIDAFRAWEKTRKIRPGIEIVLKKLNELKETEQWSKDEGKFIPYPATWLNRGGWDDECEVETAVAQNKGFSMEELHAAAAEARRPIVPDVYKLRKLTNDPV